VHPVGRASRTMRMRRASPARRLSALRRVRARMSDRQLFHVEFGIVARTKGNDARKVSAYQMCARVPRRDGKPYDFRRKRGEHVAHAMLLPADAPAWAADPAQLWQRAEDAEKRGDAQTARLVEIAIPREVPAHRRMDFVRAIVEPWIANGMAAQVDLHCTRATDAAEQPHAHILLTLRRLDCDGLARTKERNWNQIFTADQGRRMREEIAGRMNAFMVRHEIPAQVDHRTHEAQGVGGPAPERNVSQRSWGAHHADPAATAAAPVRAVLEDRQHRGQRGRDMAWDAARADYAAAAALHYEAEQARRQAGYAADRQAERAARDVMRTQQRAARDHTYRHTQRGFLRNVLLALQRGQHARQAMILDTHVVAGRMTTAPSSADFPGFDAWLDDKATAGDVTATAALKQRVDRRAWLAKQDPAAAARRALDDVIRASERVLRGRPRGSVDADALFVSARNRLTKRRDAAAEAARAALHAVWDHHRAASWWARWTDAEWGLEHGRLTGIAQGERRAANRLARGYDGEIRTARLAAQKAARDNRKTLVEWLSRPDVQGAQASRATAERVGLALESGDQDTRDAAARGDLPAAAQATQAAEERRIGEAGRLRRQADASRAAMHQTARERAHEAAQQAAAQRRASVQAPQSTSAASSPGLRLG